MARNEKPDEGAGPDSPQGAPRPPKGAGPAAPHKPVERDRFARDVETKERRKVRARRERRRSPWFWAGMFGLVGWSVAVPTLLGVLAGWFLDRRLGGQISWTLTGLVIGMALGCLNAWFWVKRESRRED